MHTPDTEERRGVKSVGRFIADRVKRRVRSRTQQAQGVDVASGWKPEGRRQLAGSVHDSRAPSGTTPIRKTDELGHQREGTDGVCRQPSPHYVASVLQK